MFKFKQPELIQDFIGSKSKALTLQLGCSSIFRSMPKAEVRIVNQGKALFLTIDDMVEVKCGITKGNDEVKMEHR